MRNSTVTGNGTLPECGRSRGRPARISRPSNGRSSATPSVTRRSRRGRCRAAADTGACVRSTERGRRHRSAPPIPERAAGLDVDRLVRSAPAASTRRDGDPRQANGSTSANVRLRALCQLARAKTPLKFPIFSEPMLVTGPIARDDAHRTTGTSPARLCTHPATKPSPSGAMPTCWKTAPAGRRTWVIRGRHRSRRAVARSPCDRGSGQSSAMRGRSHRSRVGELPMGRVHARSTTGGRGTSSPSGKY